MINVRYTTRVVMNFVYGTIKTESNRTLVTQNENESNIFTNRVRYAKIVNGGK